jgi:SAM-dependent methyltransferase
MRCENIEKKIFVRLFVQLAAFFHTFGQNSVFKRMKKQNTGTYLVSSLLLFSLLLLTNACVNDSKNSAATNAQATQNTNDFKPLVADYEDKSRYIWQQPDMVIKLLGDISQKTVADLGAGEGYFTFRILPKAKKVIAIDISPRYTNYIDSLKTELPEATRPKLETRLVTPDNPSLKTNEVDAVVVVNTYMYIENRVAYLKKLRSGMTKGALVLIVDYKERNLPVGPPSNIKVALSAVEKELKEAGFGTIVSDDTSLDYQYIITAKNQ